MTGEPIHILTPDSVMQALHNVIDPELGYNIVDLGLIYGLEVNARSIRITMTMTTPGCPAQDYILTGVYACGHDIPGVEDVDVVLVWDPPWTPQKMTAIAKEHFGIEDDL